MSCTAKTCRYYSSCVAKRDLVGDTRCGDYEPKPSSTRQSSYERTRAQVYATGNKWAIENFNATH